MEQGRQITKRQFNEFMKSWELDYEGKDLTTQVRIRKVRSPYRHIPPAYSSEIARAAVMLNHDLMQGIR